MSVFTVDKVRFGLKAQVVLRVLIASYFLAVALKLIPGVDYAALFSGFISSSVADGVAAGLVFLLTFSIMIGFATRLCAVLLAAVTICASALHVIAALDPTAIASFWTDLALVAGLMLLYGGRIWTPRQTSEPANTADVHNTAEANTANAPRRVNIDTDTKMTDRPTPRAEPEDAELHNIFQAVDRAKAAMARAQPQRGAPADQDPSETPITFLRSEFGRRTPEVTEPVDNIFVVDQNGRVLDADVPIPRRVATAR